MPEPLLLPGQSAAPPGPADMTMMYVLHHAFRRDLRDFRTAVGNAAVGDRRAWTRLRERWQLFTAELHAHHVKEDVILWPLLTQRAQDAGDHDAVRVLEAMEEEHAVLDPLLTSCDASFTVLAHQADAEELAGLSQELAELEAVLHEHLAHEEEAAVAILQRYVGGEEWARLERERFRGKQSLGHARRFIPWAFKGLPPEAAAHVGRLGGSGMRVLLAVSRRRFDRGESLVFGA
jgi:iron-sulfur cluster repair protein YtfE (RIC family)